VWVNGWLREVLVRGSEWRRQDDGAGPAVFVRKG